MNTTESETTTAIGLDRVTVCLLIIGVTAVLFGVGIGVVHLLAFAVVPLGIGERWWWIAAGGAVLWRIGGQRAARRWSAGGDSHSTNQFDRHLQD